ncbi:T9SS type A sorting domain-containing protein, partial [candidate division WOR-3 bacterium]|nr:T9SS type A sorting domain-containing protein [candidate division WOR-3 bacterium]
PALGSANSKKKVKTGGDLTGAGPLLYALKGNKCLEFWRYVPASAPVRAQPRLQTGIQALSSLTDRSALAIMPNPLRAGFATLQWDMTPFGSVRWRGVPSITIFDATGRQVMQSSLPVMTGSSTLDLRSLPAGVYLARLGAATGSRQLAATRLVVVR